MMRVARTLQIEEWHDPRCAWHRDNITRSVGLLYEAQDAGFTVEWNKLPVLGYVVPLLVMDGGLVERVPEQCYRSIGVADYLWRRGFRRVYYDPLRDVGYFAPRWMAWALRSALSMRDRAVRAWARIYLTVNPSHPECTRIPWPSWLSMGF